MWYKSFVEAFSPNRVQVVRIAHIGDVGIALNGHVDLPQHVVGLLLGELAAFLLLVLPLLAHQYLLELLGQDVDVPREEGEQVRVVEVDVEVQLFLLVRTGQVHVHRVRDVLPQDGYGLR
jgi:hypothetical protein